MPTFGDTLSDDEVKYLVGKYGRDKAIAAMELPDTATDQEIKAAFGVGGKWVPEEATQESPEAYAARNSREMDPKKVAGLFEGIGAASGVAAPFVAASAAGAPMLPVAGGLALATGAGLAANEAGERTGLFPLMRESAKFYRSALPEYKEGDAAHRFFPGGGTGYNLFGNVANELTPEGISANIAGAGPAAATAAAGGLAAAKGSKAVQAAGRRLFGPPQVPAGQESGAIMDLGVKQFSNRLAKPKPSLEIGEMKDSLGAARSELGAGVGVAEKAAMSAAKKPESASAMAGQAVEEALQAKGVRKGEKGYLTKLSETPKESKKIAGYLKEVVPDIKEVADMDILARQAANEASMLKDKGKLKGGAAYSEVANKLQKAIESLVPEKQMGDLNAARRKFSTLRSFEELVLDSDKNGEFSPDKFAAAWKRLSEADRQKKFDAPQIEAIDYLLKQKTPGLISKGLDTMAKAVQIAISRSAGRGSRFGSLLSERAEGPVRFNLPERPNVPAKPTAAGGAALGGFFAQPSTQTAR